jgi:hypothetical protein
VELRDGSLSWFSGTREESLTMGKRGHREVEILRVLREAEAGDTVAEMCRSMGLTCPRENLYQRKREFSRDPKGGRARKNLWSNFEHSMGVQVGSQKQTNSPNGRFVTHSIYGSYVGGYICPKTGHTPYGNPVKLGENKCF